MRVQKDAQQRGLPLGQERTVMHIALAAPVRLRRPLAALFLYFTYKNL